MRANSGVPSREAGDLVKVAIRTVSVSSTALQRQRRCATVKVGPDASKQCNFGAPTSQSFEIEAFMPKKVKPRSYDEVLTQLRTLKFDVREVPGVANQVQVAKYGAAAVLTRAKDGGGVAFVTKPGLVFGGEIAHLLDRGFQKFFKSKHIELPATAD